MNNFKSKIENQIINYMDKNYEKKVSHIIINDVKTNHGDYAIPCFSLAKELKMNPKDLAEIIANEIEKIEDIKSVQVVNGFINIFVKQNNNSIKVINQVINDPEFLNKPQKNKKYIINSSFINCSFR